MADQAAKPRNPAFKGRKAEGDERCHARNRKGERCGRWAEKPYKVCGRHGAAAGRAIQGKPNMATMRHGLRSAYVRVEDLPLYGAVRDDLETNDGTDVLSDQAAITAVRLARIERDHPEGIPVESLPAVLAAEGTLTRSVVERAKIKAEKARQDVGPIGGEINVVIPDRSRCDFFKSITPAGVVVSVRKRNAQYQIQQDGEWYPARVVKADDGADCYELEPNTKPVADEPTRALPWGDFGDR